MKGILFNTKMVQAILENRKFETRRPIKYVSLCGGNLTWTGYRPIFEYGKFFLEGSHHVPATTKIKPKYQVGDILYVRETFNSDGWDYGDPTTYKADFTEEEVKTFYHDCTDFKWRPSIHMPKEAARIFLEVADVRVERLRDITIEQLAKEGFGNVSHPIDKPWYECARELFISTFLEIYPDCTEESYVWVYEFKRVDKPEVADA